MNNVTVCIKTFIRIAPLERALESLVGKGFAEVIIADDSPMNEDRVALYDRFRKKLPLRVLELPFRSGISFGRNRLVEACTTPYLLLMDDDHFLNRDISPMLEILQSDPHLGAVAAISQIDGKYYSGAGNLHRFGSLIVHDIGFGAHRKVRVSPAGTPYYTYEMVGNFALFRAQVFADVKWDENILIAREHMDFYLTHRALGRWQFAVTPSCTFGHSHEESAEIKAQYQQFRLGPEIMARMNDYFNRKWGLRQNVVWGRIHRGKGRGIKAGLIHSLVFVGLFLQRLSRS